LWCKSCEYEQRKIWGKANPDKVKENNSTYRKANLELLKRKKNTWYDANAEHVKAKAKARIKADPEKYRNHQLTRKYGLTVEQFEKMLEQQNGSCAICKRHKSNFNRNLDTDHCHKTGIVRGILCSTCNKMLGMFKDDPEVLRSGAEYLEAFHAKMSNPQEVSGQEEAKDSMPVMSNSVCFPNEAEGKATTPSTAHARQEEV